MQEQAFFQKQRSEVETKTNKTVTDEILLLSVPMILLTNSIFFLWIAVGEMCSPNSFNSCINKTGRKPWHASSQTRYNSNIERANGEKMNSLPKVVATVLIAVIVLGGGDTGETVFILRVWASLGVQSQLGLLLILENDPWKKPLQCFTAGGFQPPRLFPPLSCACVFSVCACPFGVCWRANVPLGMCVLLISSSSLVLIRPRRYSDVDLTEKRRRVVIIPGLITPIQLLYCGWPWPLASGWRDGSE